MLPLSKRKEVILSDFTKVLDELPSNKSLDALWMKCIKARAGHKSELSHHGGTICGHHIFHKPNLRLRWALEFGICLTNGEHFTYHNLEKSAFFPERKRADEMRARFLIIRKKTEEEAMILKRQIGGVDRFAVKRYLEQKFYEFTH